MNNISHVHDCYGCGVCASSCPKKIIKIRLNKNGFYEPKIDDDNLCIDCGICLDICAFQHKELAITTKPLKSWAAWSNDDSVCYKCSSGGIGFEIGKHLIGKGYFAVGCRYNVSLKRAEHFIANSVEQYIPSIGSKYIQSNTEYAFCHIDRKGKYLITGTPCQIDSFRRMIRKFHCEDNFILMDFYCHCVPSIFAWHAYLRMVESKIGKIRSASWRNKNTGWHDSWAMKFEGVSADYMSWMSKGDLFYKLFLGDMCMGTHCIKSCKYKWDSSSADIRIGDLWGKTYNDNEKGVSALVAFTKRGEELVNELSGVSLEEQPFDVVSEGQMKNNAHPRWVYPLVMLCLRNGVNLNSSLFKLVLKLDKIQGKFDYYFKK